MTGIKGRPALVLLVLLAIAAVGALAFIAWRLAAVDVPFGKGSVQTARIGVGPIVSAADMRIGEERTGSLTIANTGTAAARYFLRARTTGSVAVERQLDLTIDCRGHRGVIVYKGPLDRFRSVDLGLLCGLGGRATLFFAVTLESTRSNANDDALQGRSASADFSWVAVQG